MKEKLEAEKAWKSLVDAYRAAAATFEENPGLVEKALRERRRSEALNQINAALMEFKKTEWVKKNHGTLENVVSNLAKTYRVIIENHDTEKVYDTLYQKTLSHLADPIIDLTFRASHESLTGFYDEIQQRKQQSEKLNQRLTECLTLLAEIKPTELSEKLQAKFSKLSYSLKPEKMPERDVLQHWVNFLKEPRPFNEYQREIEKAPVGIQLLFGLSREEYQSVQDALNALNVSTYTPTMRR